MQKANDEAHIVKLGFTGIYIIFFHFALKRRLWVYILSKNKKNIKLLYLKKYHFYSLLRMIRTGDVSLYGN